jgi:hypothetical protein
LCILEYIFRKLKDLGETDYYIGVLLHQNRLMTKRIGVGRDCVMGESNIISDDGYNEQF